MRLLKFTRRGHSSHRCDWPTVSSSSCPHHLIPRRHVLRTAAELTTGTIITALSAVTLFGTGAAVASMVNKSPRSLVSQGMDMFRQNRVEESIELFDQAIKLDPSMKPFLWQRGLSLFYADRFADGAEQFRADVAVNPADSEEALWTYLCEARLVGPETARAQFLRVGRDSRPVMRTVDTVFLNGTNPDAILATAGNDTQGHDRFYALLYHALFHESTTMDVKQAEASMVAACQTLYARQSGDYMAALARVSTACDGGGNSTCNHSHFCFYISLYLSLLSFSLSGLIFSMTRSLALLLLGLAAISASVAVNAFLGTSRNDTLASLSSFNCFRLASSTCSCIKA